MKFMYFFLNKININFICIAAVTNMVSVTSASRYITSASLYHPRYQSRSSMYISGLMEFRELAKAVLIVAFPVNTHSFSGNINNLNAFLKVFLSTKQIIRFTIPK